LVSPQAHTYAFSTYAPLRIEEHGCSYYGSSDCPPFSPFYIHFNNLLDATTDAETLLTVEPEIPGVNANLSGNTISIQGQTAGQTTYTVTVSGKLRDVFGQELGKDARLVFKVGRASPVLVGPEKDFITIDPYSSKPVFSAYVVNIPNLDVKIYAVRPEDWPAYQDYLRERYSKNPLPMPGRLIYNGAMRLNTPADTLSEVDIDLQPYLVNGLGHLVVMLAPPPNLFDPQTWFWGNPRDITAWVQVTQIGLDTYADYESGLVWATSLKDGSPLASVRVRIGETGQEVLTGTDGTARLPALADPDQGHYLVARLGRDEALLRYYKQPSPQADSLRWYVFDDRGMYRPGEEVHVKGWIRNVGGGKTGDVLLPWQQSVSYQIRDALGNEIGGGSLIINPLGGFDFAFTIPEPVNLGYASIHFMAAQDTDGRWFAHQFQIQEFRRPEFEVLARQETSGPYFAGDHALLAVDAKYYAGGGLPNADVTWTVRTSPGSYSPPNWLDFTFGSWRPWWFYYDHFDDGGDTTTETFTGKTDAAGIHYLRLDFTARGNPENGPRPQSVSAEASVLDVNRQAWAASTSLLVHPADVYIGLKSDRYFVERGTPLRIDFIVTDLDGKPVAGRPVEMTAARLVWKSIDGQWQQVETDVQQCTQISVAEPGSCEFGTPLGGSYQITALVTDAQGRKNQTRFTRWVSGGEIRPSRSLEQEQVTLIPDKETYAPGDTAEILVQSPFAPAEGLLTVSRSGILYSERFSIDASGSTTLRVRIEEAHLPNLNIQVDLNGASARVDDQGQPTEGLPARPAFASGTLKLSIPPLGRSLDLQVAPLLTELEPGGATSLNVTLKDAAGNPVPGAEVAVVVVDEAILALTNYQAQDPLTVFYQERGSGLSTFYGRASILLDNPLDLSLLAAKEEEFRVSRILSLPAGAAAPQATMSMELAGELAPNAPGQAPQPIRIRADFNPLAVFSPTVKTGADGTATVQVKLPDNLTRYRVMAVAVDAKGSRFGSGESNLTARLPLMVRPSAPRFLNFGDKFELPVVLQNQTGEALTVLAAARASNLSLLANGIRVTVPAHDRVEVRFPAVTDRAGTARVQVAAVSGAFADAATVELPVYTPATSEAFATYGTVDEGTIAQPVQYPSGVFPQYGGLEISTSSTALQALTDAVLYLVAYEHECSEQLASRVLAVAALRDVLTAFEAEDLPTPGEMEAAVDRDIARLYGMQNYDGGFPYWQRGYESNPFNTIHVAHALARAEQKGFAVPADMKQNVLGYLRDIENHYPYWYSPQTRWTLSAYALSVRSLMGERDPQKAEALINEAGLDKLSMQAIGWLWPLEDNENRLEEIRRLVNNRVVETAGAANFITDYDDQTYLLLSSDRRTDAILLDALIEDSPQSDLIPKLVNGLLAHRVKGRWGSTQENVFVLLALDRYFNTYEAQTPDFVARVWLGETYAGSSEFRGRTTERHETLVPMRVVLDETSGGMENLILSKDGPGRLYYRLGLRYAPDDLVLKPLDMGFVIERSYEGVDDPKDVYRDAQGVWHVKAGARVRVRIKMVADNRRYHVALVDPLPAGLEIVNPALAVSGSTPQKPSDTRYGWWWWGTWYEHQNMRDSRAEAFTSLLWDGVYEYTYIARATTPGTFVVPPAKAEEMYSPEVFGRSASDVVIVE
jgi:hypothetical protein